MNQLSMLSPKNLIFIILTFLTILSSNGYSKNIDGIINFGDSLFNQQEYDAALNEYQRAFFFSLPCDKQALSNKIAGCYLVTKEFDRVCDYLDSALYYSVNDSEKVECTFHKIQCCILERNYGYALLKLNEVEPGLNSSLKSKKELLQGISYFCNEQYDKAFQTFDKVIDTTDTVKILQLSYLFNDLNKLKRPYPAVATVMSILVPGSGQVYAGNLFAGINSILLLTGLTYLSFQVPILAVITIPFIYRYYMGGILHSNQYAKERKLQKKNIFYNDLMTLIPEVEFSHSLFKVNSKEYHYNEYIKSSDSEMKVIFSFLFLTYKQFFSSQDVNACVFLPSCSVYMMEEIKKEGAFLGFLDGLDRLLRCHSFVNDHDYPYDMITEKYDDEP
jgi:putative component of membrane protein insertase Oxa1/YidC/SpoIIIJ protein YidD/tetratricopeptide (TPR) repeat protein